MSLEVSFLKQFFTNLLHWKAVDSFLECEKGQKMIQFKRSNCAYRKKHSLKIHQDCTNCVSNCWFRSTVLLLWLWGTNLWQIYLGLRQYKTLKNTTEKPEELSFLDDEKFTTSRSYALDKITHSIMTCTYTLLINTIEIQFGLYYKFWSLLENPDDSEFVKDYIWLTILMAVYHILDLPVSYYDSCIIKNKYSALHKTVENFFISETRFFLILLIFISPLLTISLNIIKRVPYFWFWSWTGFSLVLFFLITLYPGYISPLCEKYQIYREGSLKRSVKNFMETFGMNVKEIYELKSKSNNEHSNILIGKRLDGYFVVIDKNDLSQNEILAVLAHEIGHNYHKHHYKMIVMYSFYYFVMFTIFACFYDSNFMYCIVGFPQNIKPKVINMVSIIFYILAPLNKFVRYFINLFTREIEIEADKFAVESGMGEELVESIIKRSKNLDVICIFDPVYSIWSVSQPTFAERLKLIQSFIRIDDLSISEEDDFSGTTRTTRSTNSTDESF